MRNKWMRATLTITLVLLLGGIGTGLALAARQVVMRERSRVAAQDSITPTTPNTPLPGPTIAPTETLLPLLELPTLPARAPTYNTWTDLPSYPSDDNPPRMFELLYDTDLWAQTTDLFGVTVLAHRNIPYCMINKTSGRGLAPGWITESDFKQVGGHFFDIVRLSQAGVLKSVNYFGPVKSSVYTGFEVSFVEDGTACLTDAESVLSTFTVINATPTSTPLPTATPEPSSTPELTITPTP